MKVSLILPFFNSEQYILAAVMSAIKQTHKNWELILINDGSTDRSKDIVLSVNDTRIRYFEQENRGVSKARNVGLIKMEGDFFCFLDADDLLPSKSLESRLRIFKQDSNLSFVDGKVLKMDAGMQDTKSTWLPNFKGDPLSDLIQLTGNSFFGLSWMIKRDSGKGYEFDEGLTHCEDLLFYLKLARDGGKYSYTHEPVLNYRDSPGSAMKNLKGLESGYRAIENEIRNWNEVSHSELATFKLRYKTAMAKAYLRKGQIFNSINTFLKSKSGFILLCGFLT